MHALTELRRLEAALAAAGTQARQAFECTVKDLQVTVTSVEHIHGSLQADRLCAAWLGNRTRMCEDLVDALLWRAMTLNVNE